MSRMSQLWNATNELVAEVHSWLQIRDGQSDAAWLTFNQTDQVRLLRLRTWERRYYLSVYDILDMIVPFLRAQIKNPHKRWKLGVTVKALTGKAAESFLLVQIVKRFPQQEHIQIWRERERDRQMELERLLEDDIVPSGKTISLLEAHSPEKFVEQYRRKIMGHRQEVQLQAKQYRKKPYRWNPWI